MNGVPSTDSTTWLKALLELAEMDCLPQCNPFDEYRIDSSYKGHSPHKQEIRHIYPAGKPTRTSPNSDLILLASRPGVGRRTLSLSIAANEVARHRHVAFFSLAADSAEINRILNNVNLSASNEFFHIDEAADYGIIEIASRARTLKREGKLDLLIIDDLRAIKQGKEEKCSNVHNAILRGLKALASELQIRVIVLEQLGSKFKGEEYARPQFQELRKLGNIEHEVDTVWLLERKFIRTHCEEDRYSAEVIVVNPQNGSENVVPITYESECRIFSGVDQISHGPSEMSFG